jgi:hypothetical protein
MPHLSRLEVVHAVNLDFELKVFDHRVRPDWKDEPARSLLRSGNPATVAWQLLQ